MKYSDLSLIRKQPKGNEAMRHIKTAGVIVAVAAMLTGLVILRAADKACCEPTVEAQKKCKHECCVNAAKEGKICEKCHPKKTPN